jgi:hypothetical protein
MSYQFLVIIIDLEALRKLLLQTSHSSLLPFFLIPLSWSIMYIASEKGAFGIVATK